MTDPFTQVGQTYYPGSSVEGKVYQDLSALGYHHPAHRTNIIQRVDHIAGQVDLKGKRVLDMGCSNGALSLLIARDYEAEVTGVDIDPNALRVASYVSGYEEIPVTFKEMDIGSDRFKTLLREGWDVVLWLSQYMWTWRKHGALQATGILRYVSECADTLVFETAQGSDKSAGLKHTIPTLAALLHLLKVNTSYDSLTDIGWVEGWSHRNTIVSTRQPGPGRGPSLLIAGPSGVGKSHLGRTLVEHGFYHYDLDLLHPHTELIAPFFDDPAGYMAKMRRPLILSYGLTNPVMARKLIEECGMTGVWLDASEENLALSREQRGDKSGQGIHDLWAAQRAVYEETVHLWDHVIPAFEDTGIRDRYVHEDIMALVGWKP